MKKVLLLGASGSIGSQSIDVINASKGEFVLTAFSVGNRTEIVDEILKTHKEVKHVYVIDKEKQQALLQNTKTFTFIVEKMV